MVPFQVKDPGKQNRKGARRIERPLHHESFRFLRHAHGLRENKTNNISVMVKV